MGSEYASVCRHNQNRWDIISYKATLCVQVAICLYNIFNFKFAISNWHQVIIHHISPFHTTYFTFIKHCASSCWKVCHPQNQLIVINKLMAKGCKFLPNNFWFHLHLYAGKNSFYHQHRDVRWSLIKRVEYLFFNTACPFITIKA